MNIEEIRSLFVNLVYASDTINRSISSIEKNKLTESILNLSDKKIIKLLKILDENTDFKKIKWQVDRKLGLVNLIPVPFTTSLYAIYKLTSDLNYKCMNKCLSSDESEKRLCYKICNIKSIEKTISEVKKQLDDCWYYKNPKKCQKSNMKYLESLYKKLEKVKINLNNYQYKLKFKGRI